MRPAYRWPTRRRAARTILIHICAIQLAHSRGTALSLWYKLSAIVAGGLAGLFLLAFFSKRANRKGVYVGIAANLVFVTWAALTIDGGKVLNLGRFNFPLHDYMIGVLGNIVLLAVGYCASLFFPGEVRDEAMTFWGWLEKKRRQEVGRKDPGKRSRSAATETEAAGLPASLK